MVGILKKAACCLGRQEEAGSFLAFHVIKAACCLMILPAENSPKAVSNFFWWPRHSNRSFPSHPNRSFPEPPKQIISPSILHLQNHPPNFSESSTVNSHATTLVRADLQLCNSSRLSLRNLGLAGDSILRPGPPIMRKC